MPEKPQAVNSALNTVLEWREVNNELPQNATFVLVWGSHSIPWIAEYIDDRFKDVEDGDELISITHWAIPKPPLQPLLVGD